MNAPNVKMRDWAEQKAFDAAMALPPSDFGSHRAMVVVAALLRAEREACAKIAEAASERQGRLVSDNWKQDDEFKHRYAGELADDIAEAIRTPAPSTNEAPR